MGPSRPTYLLVDDERDAAEALKAHFETRGARVWIAPSEQEALRLLPSLRLDVVVLSLDGAEGRGAWLLSQIRQQAPRSRVIVLTGGSREEANVGLTGLRPDAYASKPIPLETLHRLLERVTA